MRILGIAVAVLGFTFVVFIVFTAVLKGMWAWTVPELFPGAVTQGLIARTISWATAAKVALGFAVLGGGLRAGSTGGATRTPGA